MIKTHLCYLLLNNSSKKREYGHWEAHDLQTLAVQTKFSWPEFSLAYVIPAEIWGVSCFCQICIGSRAYLGIASRCGALGGSFCCEGCILAFCPGGGGGEDFAVT